MSGHIDSHCEVTLTKCCNCYDIPRASDGITKKWKFGLVYFSLHLAVSTTLSWLRLPHYTIEQILHQKIRNRMYKRIYLYHRKICYNFVDFHQVSLFQDVVWLSFLFQLFVNYALNFYIAVRKCILLEKNLGRCVQNIFSLSSEPY